MPGLRMRGFCWTGLSKQVKKHIDTETSTKRVAERGHHSGNDF